MNEALNGIPLPSTNHLTGHSAYNNKIQGIFTQNMPDIQNMSPNEAYIFLSGLVNHINGLITTNPTKNLGQIANLIQYP